MTRSVALSVTIGAALSGTFNTVVGGSVAKFNQLGSAIRQVDQNAARIAGFRKAKEELIAADSAWRQAKDRVASLTAEMRNTANPTRQMQRNLAKAHKEANQLRQRMETSREAIARSRQEMKAAGLATSNLTAQEEKLGATLEKLKLRYQQLATAIQKRDAVLAKRGALRGQMMDTVALGATFAAPIKAAIFNRASAILRPSWPPKVCMLEGLP